MCKTFLKVTFAFSISVVSLHSLESNSFMKLDSIKIDSKKIDSINGGGGESSLSPLRDKGYTPKVNVESSKNLLDSNISKNIKSNLQDSMKTDSKFSQDSIKIDSIKVASLDSKTLKDSKENIKSKELKLASLDSKDSKNIESSNLDSNILSPNHRPLNDIDSKNLTAQRSDIESKHIKLADISTDSNNTESKENQENTESKSDVKEYKLDSIVTSASGYEQNIKNAPASISTIQQKELFKKPIRDMGNAVSEVPGVFTQPDKTGANKISMRGLDPSLR